MRRRRAPAAGAKPERDRQDERFRSVQVLTACFLVALAVACEPDARRAETEDLAEPAVDTIRAGAYALQGGVLYRQGASERVALVVLAGVEAEARDTLKGCPPLSPLAGKPRFYRLRSSPDSEWAAWQTVGPPSCVGVVGPRQPSVRLLARWATARPDSLLWAPVGRYLAVRLERNAGPRELQVYDAITGARLVMPWDAECSSGGNCDIVGASWVGGSLLDVEIRRAPAEPPVAFEVNVRSAVTGEPDQEI